MDYAKKILAATIIVISLIMTSCMTQALEDSSGELEIDLSDAASGGDQEGDLDDFPGLGFTWDKEMPAGGIFFSGTIATCTVPGPWEVLLAVTGELGPENFLHLIGETTVAIPQISDDKIVGEIKVPLSGGLSDPDCSITYDLEMDLEVEITPFSLHVIKAFASSQHISAICPGAGVSASPPGLNFPTDFIVAPMDPFDCPSE